MHLISISQPLPGFREHIAELAKDFKNLTGLLLQALAVAVEMPLNFFVEKHSHMMDGETENETTFRYRKHTIENACKFFSFIDDIIRYK